MFNKIYGLNFVTEPNKTTMVPTGSNKTFTWKLSLTEQEKSRNMTVQLGPWSKEDDGLDDYLIVLEQGNEKLRKENQSINKRLYWTGDLTRDYFVAFILVNAQRGDSGDYGIRVRVDQDKAAAETAQSWFTLIVQVRTWPFKMFKGTFNTH